MTAITGNTYPVKEAIKALGGKWNPDTKSWMVPDAKAEEARNLVAGAPVDPRKSTSGSKPHYHSCHDCGRPSRGYYRCYQCKLNHDDDGPTAHRFTRADGTDGVWMEY